MSEWTKQIESEKSSGLGQETEEFRQESTEKREVLLSLAFREWEEKEADVELNDVYPRYVRIDRWQDCNIDRYFSK